MTSKLCKETVYSGRGMRHGCARLGRFDGYCHQHHPDAVKARRAERDAEWQAEWDEKARKAKERQDNINRLFDLSDPEARAIMRKLGLYASGDEVPSS